LWKKQKLAEFIHFYVSVDVVLPTVCVPNLFRDLVEKICFLVHVSFFVADFIMPQWDDVWSINSSIDLCTTKGTYGEEKAAGWRADSVPGCSGC
jgi:hypothetical protein